MKKTMDDSDQKLITNLHPNHAAPENGNLYTHMFREDICLAIMPIGGRSRHHKEFSIHLDGVESEKALNVLQYLSRNGNGNGNPTEIVCDAVETISRELTWDGSVAFEIVSTSNKIGLSYVPSHRTFKLPYFTIQILPKLVQENFGRKYTICPNKKIWRVEVPHTLGGKKGFIRTISKLNKAPSGSPDFFLEEIENRKKPNSRSYFNFSEYTKESNISIRRITKKWGWNGRDWTTERSTEYYSFYKLMKFRKAQALLREHILMEINKLFERLKISCKILATGIPSHEEISEAEELLRLGKLDFKEASNRASP